MSGPSSDRDCKRQRVVTVKESAVHTPALIDPVSSDRNDVHQAQRTLDDPAEGDNDDGLAYMRNFVSSRCEKGHSYEDVVNEFKVPRSYWQDRTPGTVDATAKLISSWLTDSDSTDNIKPAGDSGRGRIVRGENENLGDMLEMVLPSCKAMATGIHGHQQVKVKPPNESLWQPQGSGLEIVLNAELDIATVRSNYSQSGKRLDRSHLVVVDNLFGVDEQDELLGILTDGGKWDDTTGPCPTVFEEKTCDGEGTAASWGLNDPMLNKLRESKIDAVIEIQTRLQRLYPDYTIAHMAGSSIGQTDHYIADPFVGNAAVHGENFQWHIDADPAILPGHGYVNREPGMPYFVTLLIYVNSHWPKHWDAETLFLDLESEVGIFVRPGRFRAILMDQDITHRMSAPSTRAGSRPRYSLVWKLVFIPKSPDQVCSIARPEWGTPIQFPSSKTL